MNYDKEDAIMTKGMAILCMLILHLFCRKGADVYGTPLLWVNRTTPFVYWFGFFAEICVGLYSICAGYAQMLNSRKQSAYKANLHRIIKLLVNYWIVLILFCVLGLLFDSRGGYSGLLAYFFKKHFVVTFL